MTFAAQFARQILLPQVGASGQAKLSAASVVLSGNDAVSEFAALWLRAGGTEVHSVKAGPTALSVGAVTGARAGRGPWVTWGTSPSGLAVASVPDAGCPACLALGLDTWGPLQAATAAQEVALGAWAALFAQRFIVGLTPRFAAIQVGPRGDPSSGILLACSDHKVP